MGHCEDSYLSMVLINKGVFSSFFLFFFICSPFSSEDNVTAKYMGDCS